MKLLTAITVVATIVAAVRTASLKEEQMAKAKQYLGQCKEQEKISDDQLAKLRAGDFSDIGQDIKCFGNCFLEKTGALKDGVLQESVILKKFTQNVGEEKARQILEACRGEKGPNKCETAYLLLSCMKKNKAYILE